MTSLLRKLLAFFILILAVGFLWEGLHNILNERDVPEILSTNIDVVNKNIVDTPTPEYDKESPLISSLEKIYIGITDLVSSLPSIANPSVTYLKITQGMRKEEIAGILENKFSWDKNEVEKFLATERPEKSISGEGYFYPGVYLFKKRSDAELAGKLMTNRFKQEVLSRYASSTRQVISLDTALKIASIIEREAGGKYDMRIISGIIWNRIFKDMSLDMDSTLQYAKGNEKIGWWPKIEPKDKYIESPYNTYANEGLPPSAISNPSLASIEAALNPKKTDCLFFLHDKQGGFHCTQTYKEHVKNINRFYAKK
ncbi:MAG: endolytic transglycosylase MltG [Patescibacteria group bacterium]